MEKAGKSPGGYNYPLYEIGVPFIFMNAVGSQRDLVTMVHEGGHAIHSFLSRDLKLTGFKNLPSEVAELAWLACCIASALSTSPIPRVLFAVMRASAAAAACCLRACVAGTVWDVATASVSVREGRLVSCVLARWLCDEHVLAPSTWTSSMSTLSKI